MKVGNVIIVDGKVGVISDTYAQVITINMVQGVYLNGEQFNIPIDKSVILLDENLNKYIDRLVRKFGKLRVNSKRKLS